jgi:hypothetical protein
MKDYLIHSSILYLFYGLLDCISIIMGRGVATLGSEDGNLEAETPLGGSPRTTSPHSLPLTLPNIQFIPEEEKAAHSPMGSLVTVCPVDEIYVGEQLEFPSIIVRSIPASSESDHPSILWIRIRRIRMFLGLLNPEQDLLDPDA